MADALNGAERLQPVGQIEGRKGIGAHGCPLAHPPKVECYITLPPAIAVASVNLTNPLCPLLFDRQLMASISAQTHYSFRRERT